MFGMVLNTPLSYRDSIWYYNTGDTRAFLAERSKLTTKLTSKVTNNSFRTWFFSSRLLNALGHLKRNMFWLLQIISPLVSSRPPDKYSYGIGQSFTDPLTVHSLDTSIESSRTKECLLQGNSIDSYTSLKQDR